MNYGKAIRFIRTAKGLNQRDLAERSNLDQSYVSLIENGRREASLSTLESVASALGAPLYLLVLLASEKKELRGVNEKQAELIGRDLLGLLE